MCVGNRLVAMIYRKVAMLARPKGLGKAKTIRPSLYLWLHQPAQYQKAQCEIV